MNKVNVEELLERVKFLEQRNKELERSKKYGLVWEDTKEELDLKPVIPMLKKEESMNVGNIDNEPRNYLIEGDNYHALKALQHTHKNKVDVIYIDPPYNTGNEFVYNDKIVDKEDNFRHSKWLSFMDKRLRLARNLMTDDGVIFVSIDDNEQAQLKLLMDDVFGERNFIGKFLWEKNPNPTYLNKDMRSSHEYIYVYGKRKVDILREKNKGKRDTTSPLQNKSNPMREYKIFSGESKIMWGKNIKVEKGTYGLVEILDDIHFNERGENENSYRLKGTFRFNEDGLKRELLSGRKIIYKSKSMSPRLENIIKKENSSFAPHQHLDSKKVDTTQISNNETNNILGKGVFDYPKPIRLVKYLINLYFKKPTVILDFFAGSGTTGHAVMELNKEDGGNRSFILCTNNEVSEEKIRQHFVDKGLLDKNNKTAFNKFREENPVLVDEFYRSEEYKQLGIARSVTRERIKRVSEGYTTPKGVEVEGLGGNLEYFVTEEFSEEEVHGFKRNQLAELALNSHSIKYPTNKYQNILVGTFTNLDELEIDNTKKPTFLINARDNETLSKRVEEITKKYGNDTVIHSIEDYYDEF